MNKKDVPLVVLKELQPFLKSLNRAKTKLNHLFYETPSFNGLILLYDMEDIFKFSVHAYQIDEGNDITYTLTMKPQNEFGGIIDGEFTDIAGLQHGFELWVKLLQEYENVAITDDDELIAQYEHEFYDEFEILEEDAKSKAFNPSQQQQLFNLLLGIEDDLRSLNDNPLAAPLAEEGAQLRNSIQNSTKQQFVQAMSKYFAKIKKAGLSIMY